MGSSLINSSDAAYPAMARFYAAHWAAREAAGEGYFVNSGADVVAGTNSGTLKINTGRDFNTRIEVAITAQDNIACCANADSTNPRWAILEVDSSGTAALNLGAASTTPIIPPITAGRVPHAWIYIPANATTVDTLTSVANGKAKIMDARELKPVGYTRQIGYDTTHTSLAGTTTSLTTVLASPITIPAINFGDTFQIEAMLTYTNNTSASTIEIKLLEGTSTLMDYTSPSLSTSASGRNIIIRSSFQCSSIAVFRGMNNVWVSNAGANSVADTWISNQNSFLNGNTIDIQAKFGTSSSGATLVLNYFQIFKTPVLP